MKTAPSGRGMLGLGERDRAPGRGGRDAVGRRQPRLLVVEGEQRPAPGVAQGHDVLEAPLAEEHLARGGVEERLLVDERQVVVDRPAALRPHGVAAGEQFGDEDVVADVLARVHEADHGLARPGTTRSRPVTVAPSAVVSSCAVVTVEAGGSAAAIQRPAPSRSAGPLIVGSTLNASLSCWVIREPPQAGHAGVPDGVTAAGGPAVDDDRPRRD